MTQATRLLRPKEVFDENYFLHVMRDELMRLNIFEMLYHTDMLTPIRRNMIKCVETLIPSRLRDYVFVVAYASPAEQRYLDGSLYQVRIEEITQEMLFVESNWKAGYVLDLVQFDTEDIFFHAEAWLGEPIDNSGRTIVNQFIRDVNDALQHTAS